jgi:hypothetical protein
MSLFLVFVAAMESMIEIWTEDGQGGHFAS